MLEWDLACSLLLKPMLDTLSGGALQWIIAEGVCYITGAVFYSINKRIYAYGIPFLCVGGSICHIVAVWDILMKYV